MRPLGVSAAATAVSGHHRGHDTHESVDKFAEGLMQTIDAQHADDVANEDDSSNAFARFKVAHGMNKKSAFAMFVENEPDAEPKPLLDRKQELMRTKEEREADAKAKDILHGSLWDLCKSLCSCQKTIQWKRWRIAVFTESFKFKIFFISLVCINGVLIGVQADHDKGGNDWKVVELVFIVLFVIEILMKLIGFGMYFWLDTWNVADICIVGISVVQMFIGASGGLSSLRMLRIFRVTRVISFVTRLNCLVQAFIGAMSSVMWVGVLLILMVYIFAIMAQNFFKDTMPQQFGTVPSSMCTLFQILTLDSWASMIAWEINTVPAWLFFIFFVVLGSFGLLNLLTGVFIESLLEMTRAQNEEEMVKKEQQRKQLISLISSAFQETDIDGGGTLDPSELPMLLDLCKEYREALDFVGLSYSKMERACEVADYDHNERTYWERIDPATGEKEIQVHHTIHRPSPSDAILVKRGFSPCKERPDGVLEGELVDCLTEMDEPLTKADYFAIMKRLRTVEEDSKHLDNELYGLQDGVCQILKACGGDASWKPPTFGPPPSAFVVDLFPLHKGAEPSVDDVDMEDNQGSATELGSSADTAGPTKPERHATSGVPDFDSENEARIREIARQIFDRYDVKCSGTINTETELHQFTINMLYSVKAGGDLTNMVMQKVDMIEAANWNFESAFTWFFGVWCTCQAKLRRAVSGGSAVSTH